MKNPLDQCLRKFVCVEANGVRYFGTLIEVGEEELYLKTDARWITVPVDRVHEVYEVDPARLEVPGVEEVDANAYALDQQGDGGGPSPEFGELDEAPVTADEDDVVDLTFGDDEGDEP